MARGKGDNSIDEAVRRARQIRESELGSPLQIEIVARLMAGRRTATELTEEIYGLAQDCESEYARVRRELKALESKGFVAATGLFGRERPYRLTRHGTSSILALTGVDEDRRLLPRKDLVLHLATFLLLAVLLGAGSVPGWLALVCAMMVGASVVRIMELLGKVS